jgi:hypothetical protein
VPFRAAALRPGGTAEPGVPRWAILSIGNLRGFLHFGFSHFLLGFVPAALHFVVRHILGVSGKQDLLPESETDFFSPVADDAYTFETDRQGRVTAMVLHADGNDIPIKRIE